MPVRDRLRGKRLIMSRRAWAVVAGLLFWLGLRLRKRG